MNKHKISYFRLGMFLISLTSLLTGCSEDVEISDPTTANRIQPEQAEVEISLSLGADWNVDCDDETRSAPPGIGGNNDPSTNKVDGSDEYKDVDKVRVITFRRRDPDLVDTETNPDKEDAHSDDDDDDAFIYDASNDKVFDITETADGSSGDASEDIFATTPSHTHKIAHGKINKVYGYEYRVLAIAYSSTRKSDFANASKTNKSKFSMPQGEQNWFSLNVADGMKLSEFKASFATYSLRNEEASWKDFVSGHTSGVYVEKNTGALSMQVADIPQLFFCECTATAPIGGKSEIIKFYETDTDGTFVKNLPISGILYRGMAKVELKIKPTYHKVSLDYRVIWIALMADNVFTKVGLSDYNDFLSPFSPVPSTNKGNGVFTPVAYCNVNKSEMGEEKTLTAYLLPCKTRLAVRIKTSYANTLRNALLTTSDVTSTGNGTGIISPDVKDNYFFLRRNHKYVLTVSDSEKLLNNHSL